MRRGPATDCLEDRRGVAMRCVGAGGGLNRCSVSAREYAPAAVLSGTYVARLSSLRLAPREQDRRDRLGSGKDIHFHPHASGRSYYVYGVEFSEVIKRRKMVRAFTGEPQPLALGTTERLLWAANRVPSAGFSQGYSFLVLEGKEQSAPLWEIFYDAAPAAGNREAEEWAEIAALSRAPLVIVPLACMDVYLDRYGSQTRAGRTGTNHIGRCRTDTSIPGSLRYSSCSPSWTDFRSRFGVPEAWTPIGVSLSATPIRGRPGAARAGE